MNLEELEFWKEGVFEYSKNLENVVEDRKKLKELLVEHLSKFFTWNDIEFDRDFNKVTLLYKTGVGAVINSDNMSNLGMDWMVMSGYDDRANRIIVIEVYPFGLPEEGEFIED